MSLTPPFGKLPRSPQQAGLLFRRSPFFTGEVKAYFGPGQRASMIGGFNPTYTAGQYWQCGTPASADLYTRPADWPAAGTLLRPPQVVWLEYMAGGDGGGGFEDPFYFEEDTDSGSRTQTQANQGIAEHDRLRGIFDGVKETLATIRRGITFVDVQDWNEHYPDADYTYVSFPGGSDGVTIAGYWPAYDGAVVWLNEDARAVQVGAGFLKGPATTAPFFGTDFLHVYCGDAILSASLIAQKSIFYGVGEPGLPDSGGFWDAAYRRLKAAYPSFVRYSARLFHPFSGAGYTHWEVDTGQFTNTNMGDLLLDSLNATADLFDQAASIAAGDGIDLQHVGSTDLISSEVELLSLIADHFHFDPGTGRDLPLPSLKPPPPT